MVGTPKGAVFSVHVVIIHNFVAFSLCIIHKVLAEYGLSIPGKNFLQGRLTG